MFVFRTMSKSTCEDMFFDFVLGNFAQLCEFISRSYEVLSKNAGHLDNVLGTFDLQQHSLGVLGIL